MNGPNAVFILGAIEFILTTLFLLKVIFHHYLLKIKYRARPNSCFWLYSFGIFTLWLYTIVHNLGLYQNSGQGPIILQILNPVTIDYFRNLLFTAFFVYLNVFAFKLITNVPTENVYEGAIRTKMLKLKHATNIVYNTTILSVFLQAVMVGLTPHFFNSTLVRPELIGAICIIPITISLCYFYFRIGLFKPILKWWIWYSIVSILILPLSLALEFLNYFSDVLFVGDSAQTGLILMITFRAPFIVFRFLQFFFLTMNLVKLQDVRLCHD